MFRRCNDNDGRIGCTPSHTSYVTGQAGDCDEHRRGNSGDHHTCRDADNGGHGDNTAASRRIYADAARHREPARSDDGCGRGWRRSCSADLDDSAGHRRDHDDADARQVGDG